MKKLYFLTIVFITLVLTSCKNDPVLYDGPTFLEFTNSSAKLVVRDADSGTLDVEVGISNKAKEDMTINIVVDGDKTTAVEGRDFEFVSKVVTIPAGKNVGTFKIKGNYDNLTPEGVKLVVKMDVDKTLLQESIGNEMTINLSRFFEVTMDWICGDWIWTDYDLETGQTTEDDTYPVRITKVSDDKIEIYNIWAGGKTVTATVDLENSQISIAPDQVIYVDSSYGNTYMDWFSGAAFSRTLPISGECTYRGIEIDNWGAFVNDYNVGSYFGAYTSFLTKQE